MKKPRKFNYADRQEKSGFKVGDMVKVLRTAKDYERGWGTCWLSPSMDVAVNRVFTITEINYEHGMRLVSFGSGYENASGFWYPFFILKKVE
jgi:hypothetical protein